MVGTRKGAFLFWSDQNRKQWKRSFHHEGWMVHHMIYDTRNNEIYSATSGEVFGGLVQRSPDFGKTWEHHNEKLDYPSDSEHRVRKIWHVEPGPESTPNRIYAGVERAGLFVSDDKGTHWESVDSLNNHATSELWTPGGGGLILHTIVLDPQDDQRMYVGISAAGVYRTDDGGKTWAPKNKNVRADFLSDPLPEVGQCVHKFALHPAKPEILYQQNHCGMYRSDDRGDNWIDIGDELPSRFGFALSIHAHDPDTVYIVPLVGDDRRYVADGDMSVWRSRDRGESWEHLTRGLPKGAYLTILRENLAVDEAHPCGVYVGTQTGQIFFSADEGASWELMADFLPPVYSVSTAIVA